MMFVTLLFVVIDDMCRWFGSLVRGMIISLTNDVFFFFLVSCILIGEMKCVHLLMAACYVCTCVVCMYDVHVFHMCVRVCVCCAVVNI